MIYRVTICFGDNSKKLGVLDTRKATTIDDLWDNFCRMVKGSKHQPAMGFSHEKFRKAFVEFSQTGKETGTVLTQDNSFFLGAI